MDTPQSLSSREREAGHDEKSERALIGNGPLVEGCDLVVWLGGQKVLDRVSAAIHAGEIVSLIGPNGSGKTTLVRVLLGLVAPNEGSVHVRPGVRVGYVPQNLHLDRTLPLTVRRFVTLTAPYDDHAVNAALAELGVAHLAERVFHDLSGGERQRVVLARALLRRPDLLVLDEPTQGVDVRGLDEIHRVIRDFRDRSGCSVLLVSHDLHLVMEATDRVLCLNRHICCSGTPSMVAAAPEYQALFGKRALYVHRHDHVHDVAEEAAVPPAEHRVEREKEPHVG